MKKILFVQHAGAGGAVVSLSQILKRISNENYQVTVLLLRNDNVAIRILEKLGCQIIVRPDLSQVRYVYGGWSLSEPLGLYFTLTSLLRLQWSLAEFERILEDVRPDLVYLNSLPSFLYAYSAKRVRTPVVLHVREMVRDGLLEIPKRLYRRVIERYVDHTIFIGEYERERIGIESNYTVIPNYVDLTQWNNVCWRSNADGNRSESEVVTFLFVGGLNRIKGIQILLPALAILKNSFPRFRCIFLGVEESKKRNGGLVRRLILRRQGLDYDQVQKYIQHRNLIENCVFKPFIPQPIQEFAKADILVFPSTEPHFPRPLVEAGAMGLPVVASDLPGPRAVVKSGVNGLLVPPNSPQALADALLMLVKDPDLRKKMGVANHEIVREHFNAAINERRILQIIDELSQRQ